MEFHGEGADALFTDRSIAGKTTPARGSTGRVGASKEELVGLLPVQGIELWWLVGGVLATGRARA